MSKRYCIVGRTERTSADESTLVLCIKVVFYCHVGSAYRCYVHVSLGTNFPLFEAQYDESGETAYH